MKKTYLLDSSAAIHLASLQTDYSNVFRLSVTLTEPVCPEYLQKAADIILPCFPYIAAGIQDCPFQYSLVPVLRIYVQEDRICLSTMSREELRSCGLRILYGRNKISVEIFHSLTDGCGGSAFLKALTEEYLHLMFHTPKPTLPDKAAFSKYAEDSYPVWAQNHDRSVNRLKSYPLPGSWEKNAPIHVITGTYQLSDLLALSHQYEASLTVFLTAVLSASVIEIQKQHHSGLKKRFPVQIMVPVNLRRKFPSKTLRNFSLYALPCVPIEKQDLSFEALLELIKEELAQQTSPEHLASMIGTNVRLQQMPLFRLLPLPEKRALMSIAFRLCGEQNSSLSLSNLGELRFLKEAAPYVTQVDFLLTPRRNAPYNCAAVSYNGQLFINFTRKTKIPELESHFFRKLGGLGCHGIIQQDFSAFFSHHRHHIYPFQVP